jgi:hypothetical protein
MHQDTSNTPRFHILDLNSEPPEIQVHAGLREGSGFWELTFECPYCGLLHRHGGGTDREPLLGHRVSHCSYEPPAFEHGYVLVEGSRGKPITSNGGRVRTYPVLEVPYIDLDNVVYGKELDRVRSKLIENPDHEGCLLPLPNRKGNGKVRFMGSRYDLRVLLLAAEGIDTPAGYQPVPACGLSACVNPGHQQLVSNAEAKVFTASEPKGVGTPAGHRSGSVAGSRAASGRFSVTSPLNRSTALGIRGPPGSVRSSGAPGDALFPSWQHGSGGSAGRSLGRLARPVSALGAYQP